MMEENKFYNIKTLSYVIDNSCIDINIYDDEMKKASAEYKKINDEITSFEQSIEQSNKDITEASLKKDKEEVERLESNKTIFLNKILKHKMILNAKESVLAKLKFKDIGLKELIKNIDRYNKYLNEVNEIIKQYNYDIIYNEKNISDITVLSKFKECISRITNFNDENIETGIDIDILRNYYTRVSNIDAYYTSGVINKRLEVTDDYQEIDINGFIFDINEPGIVTNKKKENSHEIGDIDYIVYCEQVSGNIVRKHKPRNTHKIKRVRKASKFDKIKKSIRKNFRKVVAGLLVGATMIGASVIGVGFDKKDNTATNNNDNAVVDTVDVITKIQDKNEEEEKIDVGSKVSVDGDIYINADNAFNKEDGMQAIYSSSDEREVSLIYYKNTAGDTCIVSKDNKTKIKELEKLKYDVVAYCLNNNTHNINNEGWYNVDNVKVLSI